MKVTRKKGDTYESAYALYEGQELILNAFKSVIFSIKGNAPKISNSSCGIKAGDTSENVLKEIRQIIYSLYQAINKRIK